MSRSRCLRRILRTTCAGCEQVYQPSIAIAQSFGHLPPIQQVAQPGIDYAAWARQQQAWRGFAAAPARAVQDSMEEVAERKLAEARIRHEALQKSIEGVRNFGHVGDHFLPVAGTNQPRLLADPYCRPQPSH